MKRLGIIQASIMLLGVFSSCAGTQTSGLSGRYQLEPYIPYKPRTASASFKVLDYEKKNIGQALPVWASVWLQGGSAALESLPVYADKYCFVMEHNGVNLDALLRWLDGFNLERVVPKMALQRIFQRWTADNSVSPDVAYGSYFVKMLKAYIAYFRPEAKLGGSVWLFIRYDETVPLDGDEDTRPTGETYRILVFAVCDKVEFQNAYSAALNGINYDRSDSRAQINAVEQLRSDFWPRF